MVAPVYVDNSEDARRHADDFYQQQVHETCDIQGRKKLVRIVERGVKTFCPKKFGVQQSVHFEAKNEADSGDGAYCTFVVGRPVSESQVVHDLFLKDDQEEEVDRYCEHDCHEYQVNHGSDSESLSEVKNNEYAHELNQTQKYDHVCYKAWLKMLTFSNSHN